ncbi:MAG TPA: hypothetical protein VIM80_06205 [Brevefilum sp.]
MPAEKPAPCDTAPSASSTTPPQDGLKVIFLKPVHKPGISFVHSIKLAAAQAAVPVNEHARWILK